MIAGGRAPHLAIELHNDASGRLHISRPPVPQLARHLQRMTVLERLLRKHTWFTEGSTNEAFRNTGTLGDGWLERYGIDAVVHEFNCNWIAGLGTQPLGPALERVWGQARRRLRRVLQHGQTITELPMRAQRAAPGFVRRGLEPSRLVHVCKRYAIDPGAARPPAHAAIYRDGGADAGDRHRGEYGHLQRDRRRTAEAAAVSAIGRARDPRSCRARRKPAQRRRRAVSVLHLPRGRPRFPGVGLWNTGTVSVTGLAEPEEVPRCSSPRPPADARRRSRLLGRVFSRTDDAPGSPETVVLTAGYWRSKFGADPAAIGRTLMVDGRPREIIGVLPDTFRFLDRKAVDRLPRSASIAARCSSVSSATRRWRG